MQYPQRSSLHLLSTDVARRLEAYVLEGGFRPGDKLPSERELALQFGVSRTAIREGIKLLSQNGLLQSSVGRGLFVGQLSTEPVLSSLNVLLHLGGGTARDVVQVRNALETLAAELAAVHITDEQLAEMASLVDEMADLQSRGGSFGQEGGPGQKFHIVMARASHNPLLVALLEPAMALMNRVERDPVAKGAGTLKGLESHRRILKALSDHDPKAAVAAVQSHCDLLMSLRNSRRPDWEKDTFGTLGINQEVGSQNR